MSSPPPDCDSDDPGRFSGKLEPSGGGHAHPGDFPHDCTEAVASETLFKTVEYPGLIPAFDHQNPVMRQPCLDEAGHEQVLPGHAPEDLPRSARCDAADEQCGSRGIKRAVAATSDLMERTKGKTTAR